MTFYIAENAEEYLTDLEKYSFGRRKVLENILKSIESLSKLIQIDKRIKNRSSTRLNIGVSDHLESAIDDLVFDNLPYSFKEEITKLRDSVKLAVELGLGNNKAVEFYAKQFKISY